MNKKILPWLLLICALGLSSTAAYYSVLGLSIVFSAVALPVIIMGSFLEFSKLIIATYLHNQWKNTYFGLKLYLTSALVLLSLITSIGIYGLLSKGFTENIAKLNVNQSIIENIEVKKDRFLITKQEKQNEKIILSEDISELRKQLSSGTRIEYKDRETGEIISTTSSAARKTFENQLDLSTQSRDTISKQVDVLNDSITKLELKILDLESTEELNGELGVIKYMSEITGKPLKTVANWFILVLIFVFDPLAIALIIATNQSFKNLRPKISMYGEPKPITPPNPKVTPKLAKPNTGVPLPQSKPTPEIDNQIKSIQQELTKVHQSPASSKKKGLAISNLTEQLKKYQNLKDNQIEY
tara:strand:- start:815 stop:1882 length:1068 start_codon:yes stop_codon:yes gene_type:complete